MRDKRNYMWKSFNENKIAFDAFWKSNVEKDILDPPAKIKAC